MAEDQDDRTEPASPRKREEARQRGEIASSTDLNSGFLLLAGVSIMWFGGDFIAGSLRRFTQQIILEFLPRQVEMTDTGAVGWIAFMFSVAGQILGVFVGLLFFVALGLGVSQAGVTFSGEAIAPNFDKLNPITGLQRVFSTKGLMRGLIAIMKVLLIGSIIAWMLWGQGTTLASLGDGPLSYSVSKTWDLALKLLLAIAIALVLVGVADYAWQRYQHEKSLMMSRQDVRDEQRSQEGDPQVKARRRQLAREMAMRERMMADVPEATVVVTNPTHLAIALKYDDATTTPVVVAKGRGAIAQRIADTARRHSIPVVQRVDVARALFKMVKVGDEIPAALYYAVSEIIAFVYRLKGKV